MTDTAHYDVCVIGGGSGGLAVATGAALLGVPVALVEPGPLGTDGAEALATATLLAVAAKLQATRCVPGTVPTPSIDLAAIRGHVAATVEAVSAATAPERLRALGIRLIEAQARFLAPDRLATDGAPRILTARRFVIAPAGNWQIPAIPGLDRVPFLTPAGLAALDRLPVHLAVLGGGADALELAQAYRRLGCAVTLIADGDPLDGHDPDLVDLLLLRLRAEGIRVLTHAKISHVVEGSAGISLTVGPSQTVTASHVLVAAGRHCDLDALDLRAAGVRGGPDGILVDRQLRTTNRRISALGVSTARHSPVQDGTAQAAVILRRILFRQKARFDPMALPRVVRTGPGLAQVGPTERQARTMAGAATILRSPLHDNDRARAEAMPHGLVKILTDRKGRILGAGIVAPNADELIQLWQLAVAQKLMIGAVANLPAVYPTLGEAAKRAAGSFFAPQLLSSRTKKLVRWLAKFG
ncbi:MAG: merA [Rhodospirillales bacterium]|nr:merA [Rhodospirillales bacterium]